MLFIANYSKIEKADANWLDAVRYYYSLGTVVAREGSLEGIGGGAIGALFGYAFVKLFGMIGTIAIVTSLYIISILMFTEISASRVLQCIKQYILNLYSNLKSKNKEAAVTKGFRKNTRAASQ